jgi:hypothetical protein
LTDLIGPNQIAIVSDWLIKNNVYNICIGKIHNVFDWLIDWFWFLMPLSNISAISWRPVLVVEEAGVPGENHRRKQLVNFITCGCESSTPFFVRQCLWWSQLLNVFITAKIIKE